MKNTRISVVVTLGAFLLLFCGCPTSPEEKTEKKEASSIPSPESTPPQGQVPELQTYEFDVVTVNVDGKIKDRRKLKAKYFRENLGNGITLDIVEIEGGKFLMGHNPLSGKGEPDAVYRELLRLQMGGEKAQEWALSEAPEHPVAVPSFYVGKYEVTQAQWRAVARLPKASLDLPTDPSKFKGDDLPVEQVSWEEAMEFCKRLSQSTGRKYRLPSEAEWEYACKAGTTTPFHFGDTVTTELANYRGENPYGSGPIGTSRKQTIPVGSLKVANAFGLYDMHGNVSEWCFDPHHYNYILTQPGVTGEIAPSDGSVWTSYGDTSKRMVRGGAYVAPAALCRSTARLYGPAKDRTGAVGFRLVLANLRTK